jgi:hypothetical protein
MHAETWKIKKTFQGLQKYSEIGGNLQITIIESTFLLLEMLTWISAEKSIANFHRSA